MVAAESGFTAPESLRKKQREERHDTLTEVNHFPPFIFEYHTFRALKPLVHSQINNYLNFTCLNFVGCILC